MSQKTVRPTPYPLRMPSDVREFFESEAEFNSRSLNGELVKLLTERMNRIKGQRANANQK
ncbi:MULTISPECIES: Arc family DNA-binding protein [Brenneria]|uniref:Arc family DNA-binding protein n=1 Tax=Brenneria nigrifluens DSM 30175 = ATCC 13028 TaxID=1121120 RepID=A0A2U1UU66_9GAMM|nr:Arc family DNA-binding protein [Brenneria nigrifluens DSM 30175 = ATCC 13028]QCR04888.1 Arc family DNA-binding protein [Brenneria nigrifluens DSM 30175 = ATCC 13028]